MGRKIFEDEAWEQFYYWVQENRKTAEKIYKLLNDIEQNGVAKGVGKPEKLKYREGWSRRIDKENRLVYNVDENNLVHVISCKGHYE